MSYRNKYWFQIHLLLIVLLYSIACKAFAVTTHDIEQSLNSIKTMYAKFEQHDPVSDTLQKGYFYLSKPGKLRWEYESPRKITIIVKDGRMTYYDHELEETSNISVETIMMKLLTDSVVNFNTYANYVELIQHDRSVEVVLTLKEDLVYDESAKQLVLLFSTARQLELSKIFIINKDDSVIELLFQDARYDIMIPEDEFVFKDPSFFKLQE